MTGWHGGSHNAPYVMQPTAVLSPRVMQKEKEVNVAKLTQKIVREYVRMLGGTFKKTEIGDLVVRFDNGMKYGVSEYFTEDLQDAIDTARCMKGGHPAIEDAEEYLAAMTEEPKKQGTQWDEWRHCFAKDSGHEAIPKPGEENRPALLGPAECATCGRPIVKVLGGVR